MRKLIWAVLALAAIYAGYWVVGARLVDHGLRAWFAERRAAGWTAAYDRLTVRGFPSRFDVTVEGLDLYDPASGTGWQAPFWQVLALSYQPQHYIAVWPHTQVLRLRGGPIAIGSQDMRASLVFSPGPSFRLSKMTMVVDALTATSDNPLTGGQDWAAGVFRLAVAPAPSDGFAYRVGLDLRDLRLPDPVRDRLDPARALPAMVGQVHLDAVLGLDAAIDRHALEGRTPAPTALHLSDASFRWGELGAVLRGDLAFDAEGIPEGELEVEIPHWRRVLELLVAAGAVPAERRGLVEAAVAVAAASGDPETLSAPLVFFNGRMSLGPLPLGAAPRLALR